MRTEIDTGAIVSTESALVNMLRLQQLICGYLPTENGIETVANSRIAALIELIENIEGPAIVWCRFREDARRVAAALGEHGSVATITGETTPAQIVQAQKDFTQGSLRFLVATQAKASRGLNLQGRALDAIYYSQSFSAEQRWQSEDRLHRIGTRGTVMCHDILANGTVDGAIVRALRAKKNLADLALDEIRMALEEK